MGADELSPIDGNVVYARFKFYNRYQKSTETFHQFVADVKDLAQRCRFRSGEESLIRDRIIFGVNDIRLRNKFLCDGGDPSVDQVIQTQSEFIKDSEIIKELNKDPMQGRNYTNVNSLEMKLL